jgi:hypothetical protein
MSVGFLFKSEQALKYLDENCGTFIIISTKIILALITFFREKL